LVSRAIVNVAQYIFYDIKVTFGWDLSEDVVKNARSGGWIWRVLILAKNKYCKIIRGKTVWLRCKMIIYSVG